jgi:hypothetical protein
MNRYIAKLVFNINIDNGENMSQFDEQTWVIEAENLDAAYVKAKFKGVNMETSFLNKNNKLIRWEFVDVSGLYSLDEADVDEPLYTTTHESENPRSFIDSIRHKAMIIQTFFLTFA